MKRPERVCMDHIASIAAVRSRAAPRAVGARRLAVLGLAVVAAMAGCGQPADKLPRRAVSGKVTLDDKPLEHGVISFIPDGQAANPVSGGAVIAAGSFSISAEQGLTPGKYKVSITATADEPPPPAGQAPGPTPKKKAKVEPPLIPAQYNTASKLLAEVKESGSTSFDFPLTSK